MDIVRTRAELRAWQEAHPGRLGFVPTMGNLHAGHLALVDAARAENDRVAVSIFVNPTQFGPHEDFQRYPRTMEADATALQARGCDLLFAPDVPTLYPPGAETFVVPGTVAEPLCGGFRPGHFRGVTTVVAALFNLVRPTHAYFGQKDWQQGMVLRRMVLDLAFPLEMVLVPTVREADGLAMSSRNQYLQADDRRKATAIHAALAAVARAHAQDETRPAWLRTLLVEQLAMEPALKVQYADVVDAETLLPIDSIEDRPAVAAVAAYLGATRLIDNVTLGDIRPLQRTRP
jgi:pantoate--beta-alanine ligase